MAIYGYSCFCSQCYSPDNPPKVQFFAYNHIMVVHHEDLPSPGIPYRDWVIPYRMSRGLRVPEAFGVQDYSVRINCGRWIVQCDECGNYCNLPKDMNFLCPVCPDALWIRVEIPNKDAIEDIMGRLHSDKQHWSGEPIDSLLDRV